LSVESGWEIVTSWMSRLCQHFLEAQAPGIYADPTDTQCFSYIQLWARCKLGKVFVSCNNNNKMCVKYVFLGHFPK
jgi:hypothetical protein